ncbi:hypothetical protein PINS_up011034 [Pythium insidiosum]|nr:hypothetical protein PINS_up011034 [Pythium insidiosum]
MSMEPRTSQVAFFALLFLMALLIDSKRRGARDRREESHSFVIGASRSRRLDTEPRPTRFPHLNVLSLAGWRAHREESAEKERHRLGNVTLEDPVASRTDTPATSTRGDGSAHFVAATDADDLERAESNDARRSVDATARDRPSQQTTHL